MHTYIHTKICMHSYIHIHTYLHTYIHRCISTYIHTHMHTCIHIHIHTYIHTYIHTPIHTCIGTWTIYITCTYVLACIPIKYIHTCTSVLGIWRSAILWSRSSSWSRRCWSWSWSLSRSFWSRNFLLRSARDQHCYYGKYHYTEKAFKIFNQSVKTRLHGTDTPRGYMYVHELRTSFFTSISFSFFFALAPLH